MNVHNCVPQQGKILSSVNIAGGAEDFPTSQIDTLAWWVESGKSAGQDKHLKEEQMQQGGAGRRTIDFMALASPLWAICPQS